MIILIQVKSLRVIKILFFDSSMERTGFLTGFALSLSVLILAGNCSRDESSFFSNSDSDSDYTVSTVDTSQSPERVHIVIEELNAGTSHELLNTVDWELRQPIDFSYSSVTTTARSTASEVRIHYTCGDMEQTSILVPYDGKIHDTISWECDKEMVAVLNAFSGDTVVEYSYTIDIAFLNSLGRD